MAEKNNNTSKLPEWDVKKLGGRSSAELAAQLTDAYMENTALNLELMENIIGLADSQNRLEEAKRELQELKKKYEEEAEIGQLLRSTLLFAEKHAKLTLEQVAKVDLEKPSEKKPQEEKSGDSEREVLLKWCQARAAGYRHVDIKDFSASWRDGMAFCAVLHSYLPNRVPFEILQPNFRRRNFVYAFVSAKNAGIPINLEIEELCVQDQPNEHLVVTFLRAIRDHFEE